MKVVDKSVSIDFDPIKALYVIEKDKVLNEIFSENSSGVSFNVLRSMAKQGTLPNETLEKIRGIFNGIILVTKKLLTAYNKILPEDIDTQPKTPKHYGKKRILQDIENSGVKTELDRAMLSLNNMRNIYSKLKNRGIKDKINGTNNLTSSDCRDIIATVRLLENKLTHILRK